MLGTAVKEAPTAVSALRVTEQLDCMPVQAPDQPAHLEPGLVVPVRYPRSQFGTHECRYPWHRKGLLCSRHLCLFPVRDSQYREDLGEVGVMVFCQRSHHHVTVRGDPLGVPEVNSRGGYPMGGKPLSNALHTSSLCPAEDLPVFVDVFRVSHDNAAVRRDSLGRRVVPTGQDVEVSHTVFPVTRPCASVSAPWADIEQQLFRQSLCLCGCQLQQPFYGVSQEGTGDARTICSIHRTCRLLTMTILCSPIGIRFVPVAALSLPLYEKHNPRIGPGNNALFVVRITKDTTINIV